MFRNLIVTLLALSALAGCGGDAAPPEAGEGAVGTVSVDDAGAAENPTTPALSGGPAGQTPDYGQVGGVGSVIHSGAPPAPDQGPERDAEPGGPSDQRP